MAGALLMVVVMVLVVPVVIMFGGAIWSALFGWLSSEDADRRGNEST
jgi:membrane glycosyltransferase